MIGWLIGQFASLGLPDAVRRPLAWVALGLAALALLWAGKAIYDASVIRNHEQERTAESIEARDASAEERAADAIQGIIIDQQRREAIEKAAASEAAKPPADRAKLPPTTRALNCKRLEQAYSDRELAKMAAYQRECR